MSRNLKESDDEFEPKGRRTRTMLGSSVLDSPLRRSTRIKQPVVQNDSSPESNGDASGGARNTRRRTTTLDGVASEPRSLRTRLNSAASDIIDLTENESLAEQSGKRITRRSIAGMPSVGTPTKLTAKNRRVTRAGSETKSTPPVGRITRRTRASSMEPEATEEAKILETTTPMKSRRRASALPSEPVLAEETEDTRAEKTVMEMDEEESETSPELSKSLRRKSTIEEDEKMEVDEDPAMNLEIETSERSSREKTEVSSSISQIRMESEDSTRIMDSEKPDEDCEQSSELQSHSSPAKGSSYTIDNLLNKSTESDETNASNKENEMSNTSFGLPDKKVTQTKTPLRLSSRRASDSSLTKITEKRSNVSLDESSLIRQEIGEVGVAEEIASKGHIAKEAPMKKDISLDARCVVMIETMNMEKVASLKTDSSQISNEEPARMVNEKDGNDSNLNNDANGNEEEAARLESEQVSEAVEEAKTETEITEKSLEKIAVEEETMGSENFVDNQNSRIGQSSVEEEEPMTFAENASEFRVTPSPEKKLPGSSVDAGNEAKVEDEEAACKVATPRGEDRKRSLTRMSLEKKEDNEATMTSEADETNAEKYTRESDIEATNEALADETSAPSQPEKIREKSADRANEEFQFFESEESESTVLETFKDILADEWKGPKDKDEHSIHSVSTEKNESECDLALVDKESWQYLDSRTRDKLAKNDNYDSDDTVIAGSERKIEESKNTDDETVHKESINGETAMDVTSDAEEDENKRGKMSGSAKKRESNLQLEKTSEADSETRAGETDKIVENECRENSRMSKSPMKKIRKSGSAKKLASGKNNSRTERLDSDSDVEANKSEAKLDGSTQSGRDRGSVGGKNISTAEATSVVSGDEEKEAESESGADFDGDSSRQIPRFLFMANTSDSSDGGASEESVKSMDSDVADEMNLAGKSQIRYSDDEVPADDCAVTESESYDSEDDDDTDLDGFVVDDDQVEESCSSSESDNGIERKTRKRIISGPVTDSDTCEEEAEKIVEEELSSGEPRKKSITPKKREKMNVSVKEASDDVFDSDEEDSPLLKIFNTSSNASASEKEGNKSARLENSPKGNERRGSLGLNESGRVSAMRKKNLLPQSSTPKIEPRRSVKLEKSDPRRSNGSAKLEDSVGGKQRASKKSLSEDVESTKEATPMKLTTSLKKVESPRATKLQLQTSLPAELNDSEDKTNLSKVKSGKSSMLHQTMIVSNSDSPEKIFLMKEKLNDTLPALKLQQRREKRSRRSASLNVDGEPAIVEENIIEETVEEVVVSKKKKKTKKRRADSVEEAGVATTEAEESKNLEEAGEISEKEKKKKKKKKKTQENIEPPEEPEIIKDVEVVEKAEKKKNKKKKGKGEPRAEEEEFVEREEQRGERKKKNKKKILEKEDSGKAISGKKSPPPSQKTLDSSGDMTKKRKKGKAREKSSNTEPESKDLKLPVRTKRLSEEVLESLGDVAERPKKRRKVVEEGKILPSKRMFSPSVRETKNLEISDDFISVSSSGGTTQFGVVDLAKISKKSKKSVAAKTFRERMLARNPRQPISAYLIYQQKQKAKAQQY